MRPEFASFADSRMRAPRRAHSRLRLGILARFETLQGKVAVRLVDLSQTGARLMLPTDTPVREGLLTFLGFELFGITAWQRGNELGIEFDQELSKEHLLAIREVAPAVVSEEQHSTEIAARNFVTGAGFTGLHN